MTHHLKIWTGSYEAVARGDKTHDVRTTKDRKFAKGDSLIFEEWVPDDAREVSGNIEVIRGHYTGRKLLRTITYVTVGGSWGLPGDMCVFSMR